MWRCPCFRSWSSVVQWWWEIPNHSCFLQRKLRFIYLFVYLFVFLMWSAFQRCRLFLQCRCLTRRWRWSKCTFLSLRTCWSPELTKVSLGQEQNRFSSPLRPSEDCVPPDRPVPSSPLNRNSIYSTLSFSLSSLNESPSLPCVVEYMLTLSASSGPVITLISRSDVWKLTCRAPDPI